MEFASARSNSLLWCRCFGLNPNHLGVHTLTDQRAGAPNYASCIDAIEAPRNWQALSGSNGTTSVKGSRRLTCHLSVSAYCEAGLPHPNGATVQPVRSANWIERGKAAG